MIFPNKIYLNQMEINAKEQCLRSQKINYKQKNLEFIERIKEKKQKEAQEKAYLERKQQMLKENLRRKILEQARQNRQKKKTGEIEGQETQEHDSEVTPSRKDFKRIHGYAQSLSKATPASTAQPNSTKCITDENKKSYKERYVSFLQNLHQNLRQKKEIEEQVKKKQGQQFAKIREQLGFNKVQSKVVCFRTQNQKRRNSLVRSQSAEKFDDICQKTDEVDLLPRTNKNFKRKNEEYLQKIKRKRQQSVKIKEQQARKKDKLKDRLKDFVMTTVKKNVLEGVYDDQIVDKYEKKKSKIKSKKNKQNQLKQQEEQQGSEGSSSSQEETQIPGPKRKMRSFPYVTDLTQWKRKNRLQPEQKVFILTGGYSELKKALKERGWVQNPDSHSPCFDLKYTLQGREINQNSLLDFQLVNHFSKNICISTKVGLNKTLRNMMWINDTSEDNFFPKCFDLNDEDDNIGFQIHFKLCKALSILKIYVSYVDQKKHNLIDKEAEKQKRTKSMIEDLKLRAQVALNVCRKNVEDVNDLIDKKNAPKVITDKEWEILSQDELNQQSLAKKKHEQWLKSIDAKYNSIGGQKPKKEQKKEGQKKKKKAKNQPKKEQQEQKQANEGQQEQENNLCNEVQEVLETYESRYPQYHLTGHNNIWILKPAGLSRGRGITCYNNLVQIQDHVKCKESQWIAQKYIENPLVVLRRKFDIRQWVLVSDFNPLTIWMYEEPYVRFSAHDYNAKQVSNKYIHLTNNAIGSTYKDVKNSHIKGNMFFKEEFSQYLHELQNYDVYQEKIRPQIKEIIKYSLMCAAQHIQNRKNSHELFGYDLMVDTDYKVWLIQINSSPSMDYSTHVTTKLVKQCLRDVAKVIIDYPAAPKKDRKQVDTGKFKRIYKGIQIPEKPISTGLNLALQGVNIKIKKTQKNFVKPKNLSLDNKGNTDS